DEGILAGTVPGLTSPNVQQAKTQLADAQANLEKKRQAASDAYDLMICELDGDRCHGASGKVGPGPRYQSLKRLYEIAATDLANAEKAVQTAQAALDQANKDAAASNVTALKTAQEQAKAELPGLYAERDTLQNRIAVMNQGDSEAETSNTGLLAQIDALDRIGRKSPSAHPPPP